MSRSSAVRIATASGLTLGLATAGLLLAPAALAAPAAPTVTPTAMTNAQDTIVTVTGAGCTNPQPNPAVLAYAGVGFGEMGNGDQVAPKADGTWSVSFKIPAGLPAGSYTVKSGCDFYQASTGFDYPATSITVTAAAAPTAAPAAPAKATVTKDAKGVLTITAAPGQSVTPDTPAKVGERRTYRLTGYAPHEKVRLVLHSDPVVLGTFTADANGVVVASFSAPAGTPSGDHELKVTRADGSVVSYPIRISTVKLTSAELASTGADIAVPLSAGIVLVLAGAATTVVARRRPAGMTQA